MARGNGRGRGFRGGRGDRGTGGRGRGGRGGYRGGRGNGRDMPRSSFIEDELDFSIQMFADARPTGESNTYRGRGRDGRGGGQFSGPNSGAATSNRGRGRGGYDSPRGRGYESPRGRGRGQDSFTSARRGDYGIGASPRGRGRGGAQTRPGTLSGLLYQKRPLLRPIVFVPSVLTKVLFQEEEELIKPGVEDVDDTEQSHLPTADQVSRVFSSGNIPRMESDLEDEEDGEEIEEVDFNETTTTVRRSKLGEITTITEQQFTGFYVDPIPTSNAQQPVTDPTASIPDDVDDLAKMMDETLSAADEPDNSEDVAMSVPPTEQSAIFALQEPSAAPQSSEAVVGDKPEEQLFCVDLEPAPVPTEMAPTQDLLPSALRDDDEDDIIVYVAPHPRKASSHDGKEHQ
ncbi:hypothetical protein BDZ97DRAFT_2057877 [Flammula alnicola]|nr:hypothetical protein BDZ97DRAFT_2057877 [Flammula alnicola]